MPSFHGIVVQASARWWCQVILHYTWIDTRGSAWQHPFVGSHCVPGIRNRWLNAQNGFQRHLEMAPSKGLGQTAQDIRLL